MAAYVVSGGDSALEWAVGLVRQPLDEDSLESLCVRFEMGLQEVLSDSSTVTLRLRLGEAARSGFEDLRRAPHSAEFARDLAVSYSKLGDLALQTGNPSAAVEHYARLMELLDDFQRRIPGFLLQPDVTNQQIRAHFLTQMRSVALSFSNAKLYAEAEKTLRLLEMRDFEPCSTQCHLARLYVLTRREDEAKEAVENAWGVRSSAPAYMPPRVLFFRVLFDLLGSRDPGAHSKSLVQMLGVPDAHMIWTIAPVLDHVADRLKPEDLAFMRALAEALSDAAALPGLEDHARGRNARG